MFKDSVTAVCQWGYVSPLCFGSGLFHICSRRLRFYSCSRRLRFLSRHCFDQMIALWVAAVACSAIMVIMAAGILRSTYAGFHCCVFDLYCAVTVTESTPWIRQKGNVHPTRASLRLLAGLLLVRRSCCFSIYGRWHIAFNSCLSAVDALAIVAAHSQTTWERTAH